MDKLSRLDWQIGMSSLVLVISLTFFPWLSQYIPASGQTFTASATTGPDNFFGIVAALAALVVLFDLMIERYAPHIHLPPVGGSREAGRFIFAVTAAVGAFLKFLFYLHFSLFGWGFYVSVVVVALLVYVTLQARRGPLT